jgi:hypothetical protein
VVGLPSNTVANSKSETVVSNGKASKDRDNNENSSGSIDDVASEENKSDNSDLDEEINDPEALQIAAANSLDAEYLTKYAD